MNTSSPNKTLSKSVLFPLSSASGMIATSIIQPIDLIKTRMQLNGLFGEVKDHKTFIQAFLNVTRKEGVFALYNGLSAALLKSFIYTGTRLGTYSSIEQYYKSKYNSNLPTSFKLLSGAFSGCMAALLGNPTDVALIRMTADGRLPYEERRGYKNVVDAFYRIVKNEGVIALWTGLGPTVIRASVLNLSQLTSYSEVKEYLLRKKILNDNLACYITASLISGFVCSVVTTPIDIIKTRIQNNKSKPIGVFVTIYQ